MCRIISILYEMCHILYRFTYDNFYLDNLIIENCAIFIVLLENGANFEHRNITSWVCISRLKGTCPPPTFSQFQILSAASMVIQFQLLLLKYFSLMIF